MLALGFSDGQRVFIDLPSGERITIRVSKSRHTDHFAQLSFDAPRHIQITREGARRTLPKELR